MKRAGLGRFFPAALLVLIALCILNLFGDRRFGGGLPVFILGCIATAFIFLIGNSLKLPPDADSNPDDETDDEADSDMSEVIAGADVNAAQTNQSEDAHVFPHP